MVVVNLHSYIPTRFVRHLAMFLDVVSKIVCYPIVKSGVGRKFGTNLSLVRGSVTELYISKACSYCITTVLFVTDIVFSEHLLKS